MLYSGDSFRVHIRSQHIKTKWETPQEGRDCSYFNTEAGHIKQRLEQYEKCSRAAFDPQAALQTPPTYLHMTLRLHKSTHHAV